MRKLQTQKIIIYILLVIILIVLQTTAVHAITIQNVVPNLFIITIVSFSALRGKSNGLLFGFFFGLSQDIFFGTNVGFYVLIYSLIGYFTGSLYRVYYSENILPPLLAVVASDIFYNTMIYIFTYMFRGRLDILYYGVYITLPEMIYTGIFMFFLYRIFFYINRYITFIDNEIRKGENVLHERNS